MVWRLTLIRPGLGIATESLGADAGCVITLASATRITIVRSNGVDTDTLHLRILERSSCGLITLESSPAVDPEVGS